MIKDLEKKLLEACDLGTPIHGAIHCLNAATWIGYQAMQNEDSEFGYFLLLLADSCRQAKEDVEILLKYLGRLHDEARVK